MRRMYKIHEIQDAWHVVVPYHVKLSKGTHVVIGTTNVGGVQLRTNTVNITVY